MLERPTPTANLGLITLREIPTSKRMRIKSIDFKEQVSKNPSAFTDGESELAGAARNTLHQLQQNPGVYSIYARDDIIEGLSAINHPATQLVIAESVLDKEKSVANTANRLLIKAETIYLETITFLWKQETTRPKLLSIIEQNKTSGIRNGKVIPEIEIILLKMLEENSDIEGHKKAATLTGLLFERSNGNISSKLRNESAYFLLSVIEKAVVKLSEPTAFVSLIENVVSANLYAAKSSITQMEVTIPQNIISESEEMVATLNKLEPLSSTETKYRSLLALAKVRARDTLKTRIDEEKIREEGIKAVRQQEEARKAQERESLNKQAELSKLQSIQQRTSEETSLANQAKQWFPDL